ncbi:MAG: tetratricopeptide repeat protein [Candidatus Obscuribacterales bacterium]|nr:tetratricopeptide repeat protein [Candidatus Obscuribacterales bacterium]
MDVVTKILTFVPQLLRVAIAVFMIGVAVTDCSNGLGSPNWPTVNAKVLSAKMKKVESRSGTHDEADIRYEYKVKGQTYTSDCVQFGGLYFRDHNRLVQKYGSSETVLVRYSPNNPATACLETSVNYIEVVGCLLIALLMGGSIVSDIRKHNRETLSSKSVVMSEPAKLSSLSQSCDTNFGAREFSEQDRNDIQNMDKRRRILLPLTVVGFVLLLHYAGDVKLPGINSNVLVVALVLGVGVGMTILFSALPIVIAQCMRARRLRLASSLADVHFRIITSVSPLSAEAALAFGLKAEVAQERLQYSQARSLSEKALTVCLNRHEPRRKPTGHDKYTTRMLKRQDEIYQKQMTELESVCRESLGTILFDMGLYDESFTHAKRAVAIAEGCVDSAGNSQAQSNSARLCLANALSLKGRVENMVGSLDDARKDLERSLKLREQAKEQFDERRALTLAYLSSTYSMRSEPKKAAATIEEGIVLLANSQQPAYRLAKATLLFHRAESKLRSGQLSSAESDLEECLKLRQELLEPGHPEIAATYLVFANLYELQGRLRDAAAKRESARQMLVACFGNDHPLCEFSKTDGKNKVGLGSVHQ